MEIKQLEIFSAVVRCRSYARAAVELGISIPTVSSQINALEKELNCELLLRSGKSINPTEKGAVLLRYSQNILQLRDQALDELCKPEQKYRGSLTIAASSVPAQCCLPGLLAEIHRTYPEISFNVHQVDSAQVIEEVRKGTADIGLTGMRTDSSGCVFEEIASDRLVVITPNEPEYKKIKGSFPLDLMTIKPFIMREEGSGTREEAEAFLKKSGIKPEALNVIAEMGQAESIKRSVIAGLGISIISSQFISDELKSGYLLAFDLGKDKMERGLYLVIRQKRSEMSLANAMFEFMKEKSGNL